MIDGDNCNFCGAVLDAHCDFAQLQGDPRFCDLKEQYWTTGMTADQMLDRLLDMAAPEQLSAVEPDLNRRMKTHRYGPNATTATPPPNDGRGQAAAQRWLRGYQGR